MKFRYLLPLFSMLLIGNLSQSQALSPSQIDSIAQLALKSFNVPGIAIGVVKDGQLIHAKGYGVRSLVSGQKTDEHTLFGIASNSKAFTCAALGILVEEGKLKWDDKVTDYIPEFKLYNPYVTDEFTIKDLITHRSGLGLGAGDLMLWPNGSKFSLDEIIHNLRFLKPVSSFRTKFDYDNLLYIVAGEVIHRVAGVSWSEFVESRIMQPLGMTKSAGTFNRIKDSSNIILAHAPVNGKLEVVSRDFVDYAASAGGIWTNITDLSKWVLLQLNHGKYGSKNEHTLFTAETQEEMWTIQTVIPGSGGSYNTHFTGYGLGWFINDVKGYKQMSHTGGLAGNVTQVTLIPELNLGIIVLTNQQSGAAFTAVTNTIKDAYLGIKNIDRFKMMVEREKAGIEEAKKITNGIWKEIGLQQKTGLPPDIKQYLGTYRDNWFGDITISIQNGKGWIASKKSPNLNGDLIPYKGNSFIAKWTDRTLDADAYVQFTLDYTGKAIGFKMNAISPLTDFSFDFQDLDLKKIAE